VDILWLVRSFSSVPNESREKDLEKRVRSLTTLTTKKVVLACLAVPFDSTHPLPKVVDLQLEEIFCAPCNPGYPLLILCVCLVTWSSYPGFTSSPSRRRPIVAEVAPADPKAPEALDNQDGDEAEGSLEGSDSTQSPPLAESEDQGAVKKRKHPEDLISSGSSKPKDVPQDQSPSKNSPASLFDFLEADS
jgi:hypothetical protein